MNFKKKALLPAIAMVLVSVIALTGVSYAWFTMSDEATVGELVLDVQTAEGMQVSVDAVAWKSSIKLADLTAALPGYAGHTNQIPTGKVAPVSSPCTVANGVIPMFYGEYNDDGQLVTTALTDKKGSGETYHYYAFDLFFNMTAAKTLKLNAGSFVNSTGSSNLASRVAFVYLGCEDIGEDAQKLNGTGEIKVWEPHALDHAASVIAAGKATSGVASSYNGVNEAIVGFDEVNGGTAVQTMKIDEDENGVTDAAETLFNFEAGINKVRVYIWLEGQDVDCVNEISGNAFNVFLNFIQE